MPEHDKREVLLDFVSNPDALLNALHQAGWAITPKPERLTGEGLFDLFAEVWQAKTGQAVDEFEDLHNQAKGAWDDLAGQLYRREDSIDHG